MYPNLLTPLVTLVALGALAIAMLWLRQPVARRLAGRQVARRKLEASLVIIGSVLGTAIIIGALVVGDTLNHSVRQDAYRTLGPVDERVIATSPEVGTIAAARLTALRSDPRVDGVLTAQVDQAAAASAGHRRAERGELGGRFGRHHSARGRGELRRLDRGGGRLRRGCAERVAEW